jgi:glycosyltransferase involved in cell wall biosynthesis
VLYGPASATVWVERHVTEYDIVVLSRAHVAAKHMATVLGTSRRPFLIFDAVDLHYLREQRRSPGDPAIARSADRTRDVERQLMRASDMVWVTSTYEVALLRAWNPSLPLAIVPTIHEVRTDVPSFGARRDLVFVGGFRHPPNEDAVSYFVEDIFPLIKQELPDVRLLVVGSDVPHRVARLASPDIQILGYVKDVEAVFDRCRVSVAPLRYGAGVKGKVSQSMACGVPMVTTPVGAEGMELRHRTNVMIGSDPAEFARHVIEVYRDEGLWVQLSSNGWRHVEAHFGYDSMRAQLGALVSRVFTATPNHHEVPLQGSRCADVSLEDA